MLTNVLLVAVLVVLGALLVAVKAGFNEVITGLLATAAARDAAIHARDDAA